MVVWKNAYIRNIEVGSGTATVLSIIGELSKADFTRTLHEENSRKN